MLNDKTVTMPWEFLSQEQWKEVGRILSIIREGNKECPFEAAKKFHTTVKQYLGLEEGSFNGVKQIDGRTLENVLKNNSQLKDMLRYIIKNMMYKV